MELTSKSWFRHEPFWFLFGIVPFVGIAAGILFFGWDFFSSETTLSILRMTLMVLTFSALGVVSKQLHRLTKNSHLIREKDKRNAKQLIQKNARIHQEQNYLLSSYLKCKNDSTLEVFQNKIAEFFNIVLENTVEIFENMTDDECAVTIKLITVDDNKISLVTFLRDAKSSASRNRNSEENSFPLEAHSPFKQLVDDEKIDNEKIYFKDGVFIANNLKDLERKGKYENANKDWRSFYNATAISKISNYPDYPDKTTFETLGFLCVDNKVGKFDKEFAPEILRDISSSLCFAFNLIHSVTQSRSKENGTDKVVAHG